MRRSYYLLLLCSLLSSARAQSLFQQTHSHPDERLRRSVVRVWWNRNEEFRFAVNGEFIQNLVPRFFATYETDAWVYDTSGHVVAYLGPAGSWMDRGSAELVVQTTDGQSLAARLVGVDEAHGIAVVQTEVTALRPTPVQFKIQWKPHSEFYIASLDGGLNFYNCSLLSAEKQAGLEEYKLHFRKLRIGRPGNLVFTREGQFAGFLTTMARKLIPMKSFLVNLISVDQIIPSVQKIIRTRANIKSGWLGVYLKDQPEPRTGAASSEVIVSDVVQGGPADKAGIAGNDRILKVNDVAAEDLSQVVRIIQKTPAGSIVKVDVARGDRIVQLRPKVGTRPESEEQATYVVELTRPEPNALRVRRAEEESLMRRLNAKFVGMYISDASQPANAPGLVITDVVDNTPAAQAGLHKGDIIYRINGISVRNIDQYVTVLATLMKSGTPPTLAIDFLRNQKEIQKTILLK
ncbi:MAG TPA: PDZ domain-containing protein [Acidobacteriota bacterium]|jgi:S1-C subfamily serine protease|nr:PDZ domain-containing protein [Acidobacteriota bacterium]